MNDRRCGTCRHFEYFEIERAPGPGYGKCTFPLPSAIVWAIEDGAPGEPMMMCVDEGADCPCWQPQVDSENATPGTKLAEYPLHPCG